MERKPNEFDGLNVDLEEIYVYIASQLGRYYQMYDLDNPDGIPVEVREKIRLAKGLKKQANEMEAGRTGKN